MFEDARGYSEGSVVEADVCIVGGGAAGLTLARSLSRLPLRICVLESGGLAFERDTQALYRGANDGLAYEALDLCRVRRFGGGTGRAGWGGWCKPLAEIDFEDRPWIPLSGWPIRRRDLDPYYRIALDRCGLPADPAGVITKQPDERLLPLGTEDCMNELCALSPAPRLGERWMEPLRAASNVLVLLHANATGIETDATARRATAVRARVLGGPALRVLARCFVLAAGGIENPRLLLLSDQVRANGLGNGSDLVGRCFMEHPAVGWGRLVAPGMASILRAYDPTAVVRRRASARGRGGPPLVGAGLALTASAQRRERILNTRTWLLPASGNGATEGGRELRELVFWIKKGRIPGDVGRRLRAILGGLDGAAGAAAAHVAARLRAPRAWQFFTVMEQEPNPASRIRLDRERDALGLPRARLEWRLGPLVERTLRRTRALITAELAAMGLQCCSGSSGQAGDNAFAPLAPRWVWHHMGTTRMSRDPQHGVVDPDCRVHGVENLYVAGSSVFPTGGNDMPTLTIIALALRLADHLEQRLLRADRAGEVRAACASAAASRP